MNIHSDVLKNLLAGRNIRQCDLAKESGGMSPSAISRVVNGFMPLGALRRQRLSEGLLTLGFTPEEIELIFKGPPQMQISQSSVGGLDVERT